MPLTQPRVVPSPRMRSSYLITCTTPGDDGGPRGQDSRGPPSCKRSYGVVFTWTDIWSPFVLVLRTLIWVPEPATLVEAIGFSADQ